MARKTKEELNKILEESGYDRLWSWSKINCFHNSPYEYYLKYVNRKEEDRVDCIYGTTGTLAHEILERYYSGQVEYQDMLEEFKSGWITARDIMGLKFDRNSEEKDETISQKYYNNLKHFFANHVPIGNKLTLEAFITTVIEDNLFQGYIDACYRDDQGVYNIIDWKTSSIYKGEKSLNEAGQFIVYAIALNQQGVPFEKIKIGWNFLKYVSVECLELPKYKLIYQNAKGETKEKVVERLKIGSTLKTTLKSLAKKHEVGDKFIEELLQTNDVSCIPFPISDYIKIEDELPASKTREIERSKIGESLQAAVRKWLKKFGYEDEIDEHIEKMLSVNSIDFLPDEVKDMFKISDCYVYIPLSDKLVNKWKDYIKTTIIDIKAREQDYEKNHNDKAFWDTDEHVEKQSYYYATLCGYSPSLHLPYKAYLERLEARKEGADLFCGVGESPSDTQYDGNTRTSVKTDNLTANKAQNNKKGEIDLSWLNDIV